MPESGSVTSKLIINRLKQMRFGLSGNIRADIKAWDTVRKAGKHNWLWVYGWVRIGNPSPPNWIVNHIQKTKGTKKDKS